MNIIITGWETWFYLTTELTTIESECVARNGIDRLSQTQSLQPWGTQARLMSLVGSIQ